MATITLNSGNKMPLVGKGLWKVDNETCADTVYNAIKVGYRLFDGAADYGNEKESGEGVARAIKDGLVKREELFITSKLWCTFRTKKEVDAIVKKQLADWQLEYFDLLLIHFPIALKWVDPEHRYPPAWFADDGKTIETVNVPYQETYKALEGVKVAGFAKDIGVSNIQGSALIDVFRYAKIPPAVLQIEHHPYLTQEPLVALCKEYDVAITAYSSFGPQSFLELGMAADVPSLLKHDEVAKIADAHKKTSAEVLLRWATQRGIAVIPKSNNNDRLAQNLNHTEFDLTEAELKAVSALNKNLRFNDPKNYLGVKHSIFA